MTETETPRPRGPRGPYADAVDKLKGIQVTPESIPPEPLEEADRAVFLKVSTFLDPRIMGPIFISTSVRGKHYVIKYPRFQDILDGQLLADSVARGKTREKDEQLLVFSVIMGEMLTNAIGWIPEKHEPKVALLRANIMDQAKWPKLNKIRWLESRDPGLTTEITELAKQYLEWKNSVTPTEEEFSKFWATEESEDSF